jgi:hypothetical protein
MGSYCVYGVRVESDTPLSLPEYADGSLGHVECISATESFFRNVTRGCAFDARSSSWFRIAALPEGSTYVRWDAVGEFLVAPEGTRVMFRRDPSASPESFQVYLLGQALSFALVAQGLEPLHATVVVVEGRAIAILGSHAFGKSTLAASFVGAGYPLLTDDLLLVRADRAGFVAHPGPARLKLFRNMAARFFGDVSAVPMNPETGKLVVPLETGRGWPRPAPLAAIYVLASPRLACRNGRVAIEPIAHRDGFVELVRSTFNRWVATPERAARQFDAMTALANAIPIRRLTYPRAVDRLADVREAIRGDLWPCPSPVA